MITKAAMTYEAVVQQCETLRIDANQMELTLLHFVNIIETLQFLMQQSMAFH